MAFTILAQEISFLGQNETPLFLNTSFSINAKERVAVIGESGTGKTVLLKALIGDIDLDSGILIRPPNVLIAYVPQSLSDFGEIDEYTTVKELFWQGAGYDSLEARMRQLEDLMAQGESSPQVLEEYGNLQDNFESRGGYNAEARAGIVLAGLGLEKSNIGLDTFLGEISSGQRAKLLIGQALFSQPDFLVLDDPSSHLDLPSQAWLANFISESGISSIVASRDANFTSLFATKVI